jgi:hypothetical protein
MRTRVRGTAAPTAAARNGRSSWCRKRSNRQSTGRGAVAAAGSSSASHHHNAARAGPPARDVGTASIGPGLVKRWGHLDGRCYTTGSCRRDRRECERGKRNGAGPASSRCGKLRVPRLTTLPAGPVAAPSASCGGFAPEPGSPLRRVARKLASPAPPGETIPGGISHLQNAGMRSSFPTEAFVAGLMNRSATARGIAGQISASPRAPSRNSGTDAGELGDDRLTAGRSRGRPNRPHFVDHSCFPQPTPA